MNWTRRGEPWGSVFFISGADKITLRYQHQPHGQVGGEVEQDIYLGWTPCNYGGRRPWFTCWCGRRVAILYWGERHFLCRKCYGLIHASVNEGKRDRAYRKMVKIRRLLGYGGNLTEPILFKPKGMHYTTFRRLLNGYGAANEIYSQSLINAFIRWRRPGLERSETAQNER